MNNSNHAAQVISDVMTQLTERSIKYGENERPGQMVFNALSTVRPDLANRLTDQDVPEALRPDPFYDDSKLEEFWDWLVTVLYEEQEQGDDASQL